MDKANWSPEFRLLVSCMKAFLAGQRPVDLPADPAIDWDRFHQLLIRHRLAPIIEIPNSSIPTEPAGKLAETLKKSKKRMLANRGALVKIIKDLEAANIAVIALKGSGLSQQLYGAPDYRYSIDIDLLVAPENVYKAHRIILAAGYNLEYPLFELTEKQMASWLKLVTTFAYVHKENKISIELQWRLFKNKYLLPVDINATDWGILNLEGFPLKTFEPGLQLIYLCQHGAKHAWVRLFWLMDIAAFLSGNYIHDWSAFLQQAKHANAFRAVLQACSLCHSILDIDLPDAITKELSIQTGIDRLTDIAMHYMLSDPKVYFRKSTQNYYQQLSYNMLLHKSWRVKSGYISWISIKDFERFPLPDRYFFLYTLFRPFFWAWRYIFKRNAVPNG